MQTSNRFFDDVAKVMSGAASTLVGIKEEVDALIRQRLERLLADLDLVRRDEFEAVKATAANARTAQENLEQRMAELEAQLATLRSRKSRARKPDEHEPEAEHETEAESQPRPEADH